MIFLGNKKRWLNRSISFFLNSYNYIEWEHYSYAWFSCAGGSLALYFCLSTRTRRIIHFSLLGSCDCFCIHPAWTDGFSGVPSRICQTFYAEQVFKFPFLPNLSLCSLYRFVDYQFSPIGKTDINSETGAAKCIYGRAECRVELLQYCSYKTMSPKASINFLICVQSYDSVGSSDLSF